MVKVKQLAALGIAVVLCLARGAAAQGIPHQDEYIILGSGEQFTALKQNLVIGSRDQPLQSAIDAIRADAVGGNCYIQFGFGLTPLDIGDEYISFDNVPLQSGGIWGVVTLEGKISSVSTAVIVTHGNVSVNSRAEIINNATGLGANPQIYGIMHNSTGTLTISNGGSVSSPFGSAIYNDGNGSVIVTTGGSVLTESGSAIRNNSGGSVIVNGGTVISANGNAIDNVSTGSIAIASGRVSTISGNAITNQSTGQVVISGGRVLTRDGHAVYNAGTGAVNLTETGIVFAYGTRAEDVIYGDYTRAGGSLSMIIAWNQAAGNTNYTHLSSTDLFVRINPNPTAPPLESAVWGVLLEFDVGDYPPPTRELHGIMYAHGSNTGFIEIEGVTVSGSSSVASPIVNARPLSPVISVRGKTLNVRIPPSQQLSPTLQIRVIDLRGRTVSNFSVANNGINNSFSLAKIPTGRYVVEVRNAGKRVNSMPVMVR
jgi:hypothetical protein